MSDTKPWEEEWVLSASGGLWIRKGERIGEIDDPDRAILVIAAPDMARALLANGYVRTSDGLWHTDCCNEQNDGGVSCFESCTLARAALTKAGVPL